MTVVTVPISLVTYQHRQDIHHHDALMHEVSRMLLRSTIKTILRNVLFFLEVVRRLLQYLIRFWKSIF